MIQKTTRAATKEPTRELVLAIVDDDELCREQIAQILAQTGQARILQAASGDDLMALLDNQSIDCIILDYDLGGDTGLAVAEAIKRQHPDPPPIVMLTGAGGERTAIKAFRGGFADYVSKRNLSSNELIGAIRSAIDRKAAERMRQAEYEQLARQADYDAVTGVHGRGYVDQRLAELLADAHRYRGSCALIMITLLQYDEINDRFGHAQGDRALRAFAARLQRASRRSDFCGRYERGSFVYLIDRNPDPQTVINVCARLADELSFEANLDALNVKLTPAIGWAIHPRDGSNAEQLIALAQATARPVGANAPDGVAATPLQPQHVEAAPARAAPVHATPAHAGSYAPAGGEPPPPPQQAAAPTTTTSRTTDRRREPRQRVLKRGLIATPDLRSAIDCTIRDLSPSGARLRVDDYFSAPEEFELLLLPTRTRRRVRTRWQIGKDIGVEFME
jgi:diguanylate cyclase (GGDEF)-like protein